MADHADDADRIGGDADPEMFADRVLAGEGLLRHHFVDNGDGFGADAVLVVEEAAFEQWDAHHFQIFGRDAVGEDERLMVRRAAWRRVVE